MSGRNPENNTSFVTDIMPVRDSAGESSDLAIYEAAGGDLDQKALVLNYSIIQVDKYGSATAGSVRSLVNIFEGEERDEQQYRADSITSLTQENLVGVLNGLTEGDPLETEYLRRMSRLQDRIRGSATRSRMTSAGLRTESDGDARFDVLEHEVLQEIAERLTGEGYPEDERRELLSRLGSMLSVEGLQSLSKHPEALLSLVVVRDLIPNDDIREFIEDSAHEYIDKSIVEAEDGVYSDDE